MEFLKDYNDFYLRTSWIDKLIYNIYLILYFKNIKLSSDLKSYLNRRILLRLLKDPKTKVEFTEKYVNTVYFRLSDCYYISYNVDIESITLKQGLILFIQYYNYNDSKITNEIINILKTKYHEHQASIVRESQYA